jgi:hypothetical protein
MFGCSGGRSPLHILENLSPVGDAHLGSQRYIQSCYVCGVAGVATAAVVSCST